MASTYEFHKLRNRNASFATSRHVKGPPHTHPRWAVFLTRNHKIQKWLTKRLIQATVNYDAEGGASARVQLTGRAAGYEGYILRIRAGFGRETDRIFVGEVRDVVDMASTNTTEIIAYGTSTIRGTQRLNMALDYSGLTLRQAMDHINDDVGRGGSAMEFGSFGMLGGHEYIIHDPDAEPAETKSKQPGHGFFPSEATWQETERALLEPTDYVSYDNPLGHVIHKKPEIRRGGNPVNYTWWWYPNVKMDAYPKGGFEFKAGAHQIYDRVIVFRRIQDYGEYVTVNQGAGFPKRVREFYQVYAEAKVNRTGLWAAWKNTDHYVPDFNGSQAEAEREAGRLAVDFANVKGSFTFNGSFRTWWPMDVVYVEQIERRPSRRLTYITGVPVPAGRSTHVRSLYTCIIDGGITQEIGKQRFTASIQGQAALHSMHPARSPALESYRSTGLVPRIKPKPSGDINTSTYAEVA